MVKAFIEIIGDHWAQELIDRGEDKNVIVQSMQDAYGQLENTRLKDERSIRLILDKMFNLRMHECDDLNRGR